MRECQDCTKLSSEQKNVKYKTHLLCNRIVFKFSDNLNLIESNECEGGSKLLAGTVSDKGFLHIMGLKHDMHWMEMPKTIHGSGIQ